MSVNDDDDNDDDKEDIYIYIILKPICTLRWKVFPHLHDIP